MTYFKKVPWHPFDLIRKFLVHAINKFIHYHKILLITNLVPILVCSTRKIFYNDIKISAAHMN